MHDRIQLYLDRANLLHVARLNDYWFKLDEPLISAFMEQWRPETHIFHMPFGECTITLQDVAYQFDLPIDGHAVSGCLNDFEHLMEGGKPVWVWFGELFGELPPELFFIKVQSGKVSRVLLCLTACMGLCSPGTCGFFLAIAFITNDWWLQTRPIIAYSLRK
ncbi:hypothetical protein AHAS_Ahas14G0084600 [Arachis hypogaea]